MVPGKGCTKVWNQTRKTNERGRNRKEVSREGLRGTVGEDLILGNVRRIVLALSLFRTPRDAYVSHVTRPLSPLSHSQTHRLGVKSQIRRIVVE